MTLQRIKYLCQTPSLYTTTLLLARWYACSEETRTGTRLARFVANNSMQLVELNDPVHFNGESHELMSDLRGCIEHQTHLALQGHTGAMTLQGTGAHFCTGGRLAQSTVNNSNVN